MARGRPDFWLRITRGEPHELPFEEFGGDGLYPDDDEVGYSRREDFWAPFVAALRRDEPGSRDFEAKWTARRLEQLVRRELPEALRRELTSFLDRPEQFETAAGERRQHPTALPRVAFAVSEIRYSSMNIGMSVAPLSHLIDLFDKNFEYFQAAFQGFVPRAFQNALFQGLSMWGPAERAAMAEYSVSIMAAPHLPVEFAHAIAPSNSQSSSALTSPAGGGTAAARAGWYWIAANTSLLVPTALAAAYLFVIRGDMREAERDRDVAVNRMVTQQTGLIDACRRFLTDRTPGNGDQPRSAPTPRPRP